MKKQYIAPESALFEINLNEKIAASVGSEGGSSISGSLTIYFTYGDGDCRDYYTDEKQAPVSVINGSWIDYFLELHGMNMPEVLQKCIGV